jgi:hypothetical protein
MDFLHWSGRRASLARAWRAELEDDVVAIDGPDGELLMLNDESIDAEVPEPGRWPSRLLIGSTRC